MAFIIYAICLGVGLMFVIGTAVAGHIFGDGHPGDLGTGGHAEGGFGDSGTPGLSPFSPLTIACFLTAFGGFGIVFTQIEATKSPWVSAPLAIVCGLLVAAFAIWLIGTLFFKTQSSSEARTSQVLGCDATVVTPITEKGVGEITYVISGTRFNAPARTEDGSAIEKGKLVKISKIVGTDYFVKAT